MLRITESADRASMVLAGSGIAMSGLPSCACSKFVSARISFFRVAPSSTILVNTVPAFLGPSPSTHDTTNCVSRKRQAVVVGELTVARNRRPWRHMARDDAGADLPSAKPGLFVCFEWKRRTLFKVTHHTVPVQYLNDLAVEENGCGQRFVGKRGPARSSRSMTARIAAMTRALHFHLKTAPRNRRRRNVNANVWILSFRRNCVHARYTPGFGISPSNVTFGSAAQFLQIRRPAESEICGSPSSSGVARISSGCE